MTDPLSKTEMRALAAERRARAHAADPLAGETLAALFPRELLPRANAVVSGYWPFRSEIDPRPLMARLAALGARLALPATPPKGSDLPLSFRAYAPGAPLTPGAFRVPEPDPACEVLTPDVVLTPLLAFDRAGRRLGYGAGHFDRTLEALRAQGPVLAVGLAYAAQEVDRTPCDVHDQLLDAIVTEAGYIAVRKDL